MEYPNWFAPYAQPMFEKHLTPMAGTPGLRFLQIGAFTGDASLWLLKHFPDATLTDVDTWLGSDEPEHEPFDWADVERVYDERVAGRTVKFKGPSAEFFGCVGDVREIQASGKFDFIYIDGDHDPARVFADGAQACDLLKPGGLLAFDDYKWLPHGGGDGPGAAVDELFRGVLKDSFEVLELTAQAWFRRS